MPGLDFLNVPSKRKGRTMEARLAYMPLQSIIDVCYEQLTSTLHGQGLDVFKDNENNSYATVDHFGWVSPQQAYLSQREHFYRLVSHSTDYVVDHGFATIGAQSAESKLSWGRQRLDSLVLFGHDAWGVTNGYVGVTVPNLDWPAERLYKLGLEHIWSKMYGQRSVFTRLNGSKMPMFRICFFESDIQTMRSNLEPMRF